MKKSVDHESPEYLMLQDKRIYDKIIKCIKLSNCEPANKNKMLNMMYRFESFI